MKTITYQAVLDLQQERIQAEWGDYASLERLLEIERDNVKTLCQHISETTRHFGHSAYSGQYHKVLSVRSASEPKYALVIVWERSGSMDEVCQAAEVLQAAMGGWKRQ